MPIHDNIDTHNEYLVSWGEGGNVVDLGGHDGVEISLEPEQYEIKAKTAGPKAIDVKVVMVGGTVTIQALEVTPQLRRSLTPWAPPTGPTPLYPPSTSKLRQYAKRLVLHPQNAGASQDLDWHFPFAVPMCGPDRRDGEDKTTCEVEFILFDDPALPTTNRYAHQGPPAA